MTSHFSTTIVSLPPRHPIHRIAFNFSWSTLILECRKETLLLYQQKRPSLVGGIGHNGLRALGAGTAVGIPCLACREVDVSVGVYDSDVGTLQ